MEGRRESSQQWGQPRPRDLQRRGSLSAAVSSSSSSILLFFLCLLLPSALAHEAERFPLGVPPKQDGAGGGDEIKFHDPNEFQQQQQAQAPQPPQPREPPPVAQPQPPQQQQQQQQQSQQQQQQQLNAGGPQPRKNAQAHKRHTFGGGKGGKVDIQHEKEHMKEHNEEAFVDLDSMTEPQLMAQYFRTFDLDKSGRIDGLEMLKAVVKMNSEHEHQESLSQEDLDEVAEEIDEELDFYDENKDGLITYPEFMRNHKKRIQMLEE